MTLKKLAALFLISISAPFSLLAQQTAPTPGDVVVRLAQPVDFATARAIQMVRATVVSSTNPAVAAGSLAILQVQTRDGSYTLKLVRLASSAQPVTTMSQAGVSTDGSPASGQHTSLPIGATLRFTLTQQDGTPGAPIQQAVQPAAKATRSAPSAPSLASSSGTSKDRAHFEIEGVKLGQTVAELLEVAKTFSPKQTKQQGSTTISFKTADVEMMVMFSKSGILNRMSIISRTKTRGDDALSDLQKASNTSATYKKALQVYGKPDDVRDDARWNGSDGSSAAYYLDGDVIEVLAAMP